MLPLPAGQALAVSACVRQSSANPFAQNLPLELTMQFFENDESGENEMRVSTEPTGEGDSIAVPFPGPHLLLADTREGE